MFLKKSGVLGTLFKIFLKILPLVEVNPVKMHIPIAPSHSNTVVPSYNQFSDFISDYFVVKAEIPVTVDPDTLIKLSQAFFRMGTDSPVNED